jgi:hypothetical protein
VGERRVSIIIVPPGGARTVQCSISVVRIKLLAVVAGLTTLAMLGTSAVGVSLWDCATRGRALEIENDSLRVAIARMSDLDQRLSDLERAGGQIRDLLVVDQDGSFLGDRTPTTRPRVEIQGDDGEIGYAEVNGQ